LKDGTSQALTVSQRVYVIERALKKFCANNIQLNICSAEGRHPNEENIHKKMTSKTEANVRGLNPKEHQRFKAQP
jgi:hypothetical protein